MTSYHHDGAASSSVAVDQKFGVLQRILPHELHCAVEDPRIVARTVREVETSQRLDTAVRRLAALEQAIEAEDGTNARRFSGGPVLGVNEIADGNGVGDEGHAFTRASAPPL